MDTIEKSIDVNVPVRTAYNQWTQFEDFPRFMEGVKEVRQLDDTTLRWKAEVAGKEKEWDAKISEQEPDKRVAWTSTGGADNAGVVTFHYIDANSCRVTLQMDYDPEGFTENVGDALGFVGRRVEGDLGRFKDFIEDRGGETGAWRGEVEHKSDQNPSGKQTF
ncbi:MAG: SRPBCC family protein [Dehalococcoidia bacterium]